ncbi:hypothetical protein [Nocardia fluminea]|uniref:hypothetical protein n=1 Tax=Nocardia fluminea TaxID=134984 RepID=UPI003D14A915
MNIRLTGTPDELREACARLGEVFELRELSEPYRNRGASKLYRVYVDVDLPTAGTSPSTSASPPPLRIARRELK